MRGVPFRPVAYVEPRVDVERRADGSVVLRSPYPLGEAAPNLIAPLRRWAAERAERTWLAERKAGGNWTHIPYAEGADLVDRIAQGLIDRGLGLGGPAHGPLMILSGNSLEHAMMTYGAILAGMPVTPVSPGYSLLSSDFDKLRYVFDLIRPRMIFVQDGARFARALAALDLADVEVVFADAPPPDIEATSYGTLVASQPGPDVEAAFEALSHDVPAKYLLTSGSTGRPKAVINTHGMMCVNTVMTAGVMAAADPEPPVFLSWLPWSHTYGGNAVLSTVTMRGGTLYVDGGAPQPGRIETTIANLREISPTVYQNVPAAWGMIVEALESDPALAQTFFLRLRSAGYGGAALNQDIYDRFQAVAVKTIGERIVFSSGYGSTETAPTIMNTHWPVERTGLLGLPLPGIEIKLAPVGGKLEVRARGKAITPGYFGDAAKTAAAFDEEGFYRLGDAARFVDEADPSKGLAFDGRVSEDFKLETGTWVSAGTLRIQVLEASNGLLRDVVIAGLDRSYVSVLGWLNEGEARRIAGDPSLTSEALAKHPAVLGALAVALQAHNARNPGSSTRIARAVLMAAPPSIDAGEITDKGYVNQAAALDHRKDLVERLYIDPPPDGIVVA